VQPLEVVHNNILRTITYNHYRCHITPLHKYLNILKLHDIDKLELAKLMHKFHHEMLPTSFKDLFQKTAEVHCHNTRYATNQNYFIQVSTNAGKKQLVWYGLITNFCDSNHEITRMQQEDFSSRSHSLGKCRLTIQR